MNSQNPAIPETPRKKRLYLYAGIAAGMLVLFILAYFLWKAQLPLLQQNTATQNATISGTFNINGVIPSGATILLEKRNLSEPKKAIAAQNIPAVDLGTWSFSNITAGENYEITANIVVNQNVVATATPITVSAPATEETITFNLPTENPIQTAVISGIVQVNGYIPTGATIDVQGRKLSADTFTTVANDLPGNSRQFMSYTTALAGQTYEVVGTLYDSSGNQIGSSDPLIVTAPANNETLTINSQVIPPTPTPTATPTQTAVPQAATTAPTAVPATPIPTPVPTPISISGSINFNGVAPLNSRIVIFQQAAGTSNYQVAVNNVSPINGSTWQWNGAAAGTWYNIIAILKQAQPNGTDQDIADSQAQAVAAPASAVVLTVNSGIVLSAPSGPITVSCGNQSGNTWNATVSYGPSGGAQSYWLQVGSSNGGSDIANSMQNTMNGNGNQTINVGLNNNQTYYARYAYANVSNAGQAQYSPFSSTTQFMCN